MPEWRKGWGALTRAVHSQPESDCLRSRSGRRSCAFAESPASSGSLGSTRRSLRLRRWPSSWLGSRRRGGRTRTRKRSGQPGSPCSSSLGDLPSGRRQSRLQNPVDPVWRAWTKPIRCRPFPEGTKSRRSIRPTVPLRKFRKSSDQCPKSLARLRWRPVWPVRCFATWLRHSAPVT